MNQLVNKLSALSVGPTMAKRYQGRWYPQPMPSPEPKCACNIRSYSSISPEKIDQNTTESSETSESSLSLKDKKEEEEFLELPRENAFPVFAPLRYPGYKVYNLVPWKNDEQLADYVLYEDSIKKAQLSWVDFDILNTDERTIYMAHFRAVQGRKLSYRCPYTKKIFKTVSQLMYNGDCCGEGCRHCPYELKNCDENVRKSLVWNGAYYLDEVSRHRSRPPSGHGIHRRTRLLTVDNSDLGKEANASGKLAYCINTMKHGYRKCHMPHATVGDKIVVAIRGEVKHAYVVGAKTHFEYRKHGVPATDTNNIVLLDKERSPIGTRINVPLPAHILRKRNDVCVAKVVTMTRKFI